MKLIKPSDNVAILKTTSGEELMFSYETLVAFTTARGHRYRTDHSHSRTTQKHLTQQGYAKEYTESVPQSMFDEAGVLLIGNIGLLGNNHSQMIPGPIKARAHILANMLQGQEHSHRLVSPEWVQEYVLKGCRTKGSTAGAMAGALVGALLDRGMVDKALQVIKALAESK